MTISPSVLTTPNPDIKVAAFPGRLWAGYHAASENPGTISIFEYGGATMTLRGSYTVSKTFDETSRDISVSTPSVSYITSSGSFSKSMTATSYGLHDDRQGVMGVCDDDYGASCSEGMILNGASSFPIDVSTGLAAGVVNDQNTHTKYVVINGVGNEICIGANLYATLTSVTPDPVYYSQNITLGYGVTNPRDTANQELYGGNVQVDSTFTVNILIQRTDSLPYTTVYDQDFTITDDIAVDGTYSNSIEMPALWHSGTYTVTYTVDTDSDIDECDESASSNSETDTFILKAIQLPTFNIDGEDRTTFPNPGRPYNFSLTIKNSDNETTSNADVRFVEENGINLLAPLQIYTQETDGVGTTADRGTITKNIVSFNTDYYGIANLTVVPTGNKFYSSEYTYLNVSDHVGNYSLYIEGEDESSDVFVFVIDGSLSYTYPLTFINDSVYEVASDRDFINQDSLFSQAFNYVYSIFANFWRMTT